MSQIKKINHVAIVVKDIDESLKFWATALGLELHHVEDVPSQASKNGLHSSAKRNRVSKATTEQSGMAPNLEKRGEGMHHLCIEVDDIEAKMQELKDAGIRLINDVPQVLPGRKMAFIHPKSASGVLVELYEITAEE